MTTSYDLIVIDAGMGSDYRIGETTAVATIVGAHMFGPEYGELINFWVSRSPSASRRGNSSR